MEGVFVSTEWKIQFGQAWVLHWNSMNFDHSPILFCTTLDHSFRAKPFKFLKLGLEIPFVTWLSKRLALREILREGWSLFFSGLGTLLELCKCGTNNFLAYDKQKLGRLRSKSRLSRVLIPFLSIWPWKEKLSFLLMNGFFS